MEKNAERLKILFSSALNVCDLGQFTAELFFRLTNLTDRIIQKKQLLRVNKKEKNLLQILILILSEVLLWHLLCRVESGCMLLSVRIQ